MKPKENIVKNLVFFFLLVHPHFSAQEIFQMWSTHIVLNEYEIPTLTDLEEWHKEFIDERKVLLQNVKHSRNVYVSEDLSI